MPAPLNSHASKTPPYAIEAEQSVLGALLLYNQSWFVIADRLSEKDFYFPKHRLLFCSIAALIDSGQPCDVVTLAEWLQSRERLEEVGGLPYLSVLVEGTASAANIVAYADIVREHSVLRQLAQIGNDIIERAFNTEGLSSKEILDNAEKKIFSIAEQVNRGQSGFVAAKVLVTSTLERVEMLFQRKGSITGLSTGFIDFDKLTSGLQPSDLVIVAGRPSMGKCIEASSEIMLADGSLATIESLCLQQKAVLLTLGENEQFRFTEPSHFLDEAIQPVLRVVTQLGKCIETTETHPFLTKTGWKPLSELKMGDKIAVPRKLEVFGRATIRECEAVLLGYFIGNSQLTRTTMQFSTSNPLVQTDFIQAVEAFGGVVDFMNIEATPSETTQVVRTLTTEEVKIVEEPLPTTKRPRLKLRLQKNHPARKVERMLDAVVIQQNVKNPLTKWVKKLGLWGKDIHNQFIPSLVFILQKNQMALFLNRLFANCGWATLLEDNTVQIGYPTVNEKIARQIQHLLLRFGILSALRRRTTKQQGSYKITWQLEISDGHAVQLFIQEIGILGQEEALAQVSNIVMPLNPNQIHHEEIFWDTVMSIKSVGTKHVYDLTIPETHNFVANDICVHNTAFAMNMAQQVALYEQKPVAVFSMEMSGEQLTMRLMSSLSKVNLQRIRTGQLTDEDWSKLTQAIIHLGKIALFVDDTPALNPTDLRARVRRLARDVAREHGPLGLVVIDYLQLMQVPDSRENRAVEVSEISRSLKALAKELNIPVIALSQLNRGLEQRPDKRPKMSDLRESGSLEQDADLIVFIYRDEVYSPDTPEKGIAEIIIAKQRNGPIGTLKLAFLGEYASFENYTDAQF